MIRKLFFSVLLLLIAGVTASVFWYQAEVSSPLNIPEEGLVIQIRSGDSLNKVLSKLESLNVIDGRLVAKIYARQNELAGQIKVGEFLLPANITLPRLFEILSSNDQIRYRVTLVEGSTFKEAVQVVLSDTRLDHLLKGLSVEAVWQRIREQSRESELLPTELFHEGMLYPDTYFFHRGDSDLSLLLRAHTRLLEVLEDEWQSKAQRLPLGNAYEALTLASIVEKETGKPSERAEIAGVFTRRLDKGMRLQTDPTVIYGLGERYNGNITRKHLKEKTAYNTYRINGLPPTPIALAGREAINAALNPKDGKSLYFVAKGDGSHQFSETIDQHNRAVRKYQLKRRSDYRSTHQLPEASTER